MASYVLILLLSVCSATAQTVLLHRNCSFHCEMVTQNFLNAKEAQVIEELNASGENLQKYKELTFIESSFTNLPEIFISQFEKLVKITAGHCSIENLSLPSLPDLGILIVNNNKITTLNDTTFKNATSLRTIDLSHNKVSTIADGAFTGLYELQWLILSFNNISELNLAWFKDNADLAELELQDNKIEKIWSMKKCSQRKIDLINLSNNDLEDISGLNCYSKVGKLNLTNNQMLEVKAADLMSIADSLQELYLNGVGRLENVSNLINSMNNLKKLAIGNSGLRNFKFGKATVSSSLKSLILRGNDSQDIDYENVKNAFPQLTGIDISDNSWNCSYFQGMVSSLKKVGIKLSKMNGTEQGTRCAPSQNSTATKTEGESSIYVGLGVAMFAIMCVVIFVISWKYHSLKKLIKNNQPDSRATEENESVELEHKELNDGIENGSTTAFQTLNKSGQIEDKHAVNRVSENDSTSP